MTVLSAQHCAIVLVNYNNAEDTLACLAALGNLQTAPACCIVVDNASRHGEAAELLAGWTALCLNRGEAVPVCCNADGLPSPLPPRILLAQTRNTGFSGGNNAALRLLLPHVSCRAFWLLNNDTEPAPDALDALCARLIARPDAGMCGSTLVFAHDRERLQAAGGSRCSLWTGRTSFLLGGHSRASVESMSLAAVEALEGQTDFVVGASCLIRREVLERVGFLPEEYFLYYEDAAFGFSVRRAGYALAWARESVVAHKEGGSTHAHGERSGQGAFRPAYVDYLSVRNRMALIRRYSPWTLPVAVVSLLGVCANRIRRGEAQRLPLIMRAARDGVLGRMGPPPAGL